MVNHLKFEAKHKMTHHTINNTDWPQHHNTSNRSFNKKEATYVTMKSSQSSSSLLNHTQNIITKRFRESCI